MKSEYVLNKEDLATSLKILEKALKVYPEGRNKINAFNVPAFKRKYVFSYH